MPVQQQKKNGLDCDKSTSLAIGKNSSSWTYDLVALRPHLIKFVTSEKIVPFPKVVRCKSITHTVEKFCSYVEHCGQHRDNGTINNVKK